LFSSVSSVVRSFVLLCVAAAAYAQQSDTLREPAALRPRLPPRDSIFDSTFVLQQSQDSAARAVAAQNQCWRPHGSSVCPGFFLTELGIDVPLKTTRRDDPLSGDPRRPDFVTRVVWTMGLMGNDGRNSYGGAVSLTSDDFAEGLPFVVEARYKRWVGSSATADAGLGYKNANVWQAGRGFVHASGATAMVGFTPNRFVGVRVRADIAHGGGRTARMVSVGATSGWLSENFIRVTALAIVRAIFGKIGIDIGDEE
jgi:hypothetical protein